MYAENVDDTIHATPVQDEEFVTFTGLRALDEEDLVFHEFKAQDEEEFVTITGLRALGAC